MPPPGGDWGPGRVNRLSGRVRRVAPVCSPFTEPQNTLPLTKKMTEITVAVGLA